jgi:hypothetical protein
MSKNRESLKRFVILLIQKGSGKIRKFQSRKKL